MDNKGHIEKCCLHETFRYRVHIIDLSENFISFDAWPLALIHFCAILIIEDSGVDQLSVAMKQWTGSVSACCGAKPWVKREPTSRIDSPESNQNAKCPLTVEIQLHRWAGVFCHSAVNWIANNIKGTPTTPWCCPMSLVTDFIVVRQPQAPMSCISFGFYRCPPTSGPYVLHPIGF